MEFRILSFTLVLNQWTQGSWPYLTDSHGAVKNHGVLLKHHLLSETLLFSLKWCHPEIITSNICHTILILNTCLLTNLEFLLGEDSLLYYLSLYSSWKVKVKSLSRVQLLPSPGTEACHAPPSLGISRQDYWSGLPFPSPGGLPNTGIKPGSPTLQTDSLLFEQTGALSNPPKNTIKILSIHSTSTLF